MTTYVLCKTLVLWLCSRSQPGIKVIIRGLREHFLHIVSFLVLFGGGGGDGGGGVGARGNAFFLQRIQIYLGWVEEWRGELE